MVLKYVVAGTSPLAWWSDELNILLMNAVKAKWTTDILDPPIAYVLFNDTWFDAASDITFSFKFIRERPVKKDTAWIRRNTAAFLDVHMWIKSKSLGPTDSNYRYKTKKAFEDLIELNNTTLLPPAVVSIDDSTEINEQDYLQDVLHYIFSVTVYYDKVKVDV